MSKNIVKGVHPLHKTQDEDITVGRARTGLYAVTFAVERPGVLSGDAPFVTREEVQLSREAAAWLRDELTRQLRTDS